MDILIVIIQSFWIIIPAYVANASALLTGGGKPIDKGRTWKDGRRILGDGKTWQGLTIGGLIGIISGIIMAIAATPINAFLIDNGWPELQVTNFMGFPVMIALLASITYGALFGDITESFLKRRADIGRGKDWIPFDQLDFILGVLVTSFLMSGLLDITNITAENWFYTNITISHVLVLLIVTPFIHLTSNFINKRFIRRQAKA